MHALSPLLLQGIDSIIAVSFIASMTAISGVNSSSLGSAATIDFTQAIAITKTVEANKTTLNTYLPNECRVEICRSWTTTGTRYVGSYSINKNRPTVLPFLSHKKPQNPIVCTLGPWQSKKLFKQYNELFNRNWQE